MKKILMIAGAVLVAVLLFAAGFWAHSYYESMQEKKISKAGVAFVNDVLAGKLSEAYKLTSKDLQKKQNQADFEKALKGMKTDKPSVQAAIVTKTNGVYYFSENVENVPASPTTGSTTGSFLLSITKNGNSWKVNTATVN